MNKLFLLLAAMMLTSTVYASTSDSGYGTIIAVEIRSGDKPTGYIGTLEYTGETIDMVTFGTGIAGDIVVLPEVCRITEKKINSKGVHYIKCINQYGTTESGTIDFRDELKPKITLIRESGQIITNISPEGKKWHKKNIPNISLGQ